MLLGKSQRSSAAVLRHSSTAVGLLPTVPSAGSEEGLRDPRDPRRSEGALGSQKALHGSFSNLQQGRLTSPRCADLLRLTGLLCKNSLLYYLLHGPWMVVSVICEGCMNVEVQGEL